MTTNEPRPPFRFGLRWVLLLVTFVAILLALFFGLTPRPRDERIKRLIKPGMTAAEVRAVAGEPNKISELQNGNVCWLYYTSRHGYLYFGVFFLPDGRVDHTWSHGKVHSEKGQEDTFGILMDEAAKP